ncbi:MAG: hypothetical protein COV67_04405 [Nitrospinae bacterium CG11_big_fil_rev_8_21_14_0_20_56_8]|nr:MAG: hypothetical protein COV67_04405 [Nitrospinae bacterium CG11_big_fil_rev_8_21_14_0_20_56_8]
MTPQTVVTYQTPLGGSIKIVKQTFGPQNRKPVRRISFVAGLHGNEIEGIYLCHLLIAHLKRLQQTRPDAFRGQVNVYPAVNPQAIGSGSRLWPFFSVDMNRLLGDGTEPSLPAEVSHAFFRDVASSSDLAVDFHASNMHLLELPQIRIVEGLEGRLVPMARHCNVDVIWIHPLGRVFETTLGYNLNQKKIPTLVIETGICLRIHPEFCEQIFNGILNLLHHEGILDLPDLAYPVRSPLLALPFQVALCAARTTGLFVKRARLGTQVKEGEAIGDIVDPRAGDTVETVTAPGSGLLFTLREHPLVHPGAPVARLVLNESPAP